ncbi:hypothetical protein [Halalkalibacter akibai]|uniref:Uncharacterized protein n=1 Tax=Halalkalibacter akibai (strain ATCC 43226 / DSM 21942 / CIP 109018 / JCM 9157 / 1139) TaxID=1236973 RepID=W4R215_HALA3|nr:hypothetical protein [Halalkalibacter akibai]GAE37594.1 hypothetical protein JCM9157_4906 [Halalkalibacter akibai JCM 9157]
METKIEMRKAFSIIKIVIAMIAIYLVVAGVYNNSLNINILFLLAFFTFFLTLIETYFSKRKDGNFIVDTMLAIGFLLAFFLF